MDYLQYKKGWEELREWISFKPCYKWITFNTFNIVSDNVLDSVLNLVINGLPSILIVRFKEYWDKKKVLNLVINGLPSILNKKAP